MWNRNQNSGAGGGLSTGAGGGMSTGTGGDSTGAGGGLSTMCCPRSCAHERVREYVRDGNDGIGVFG